VIDPRRTETAELADLHLQLRPGTDAWLLAALAGVLVQEDLIAHRWLAEHAAGLAEVVAVLEKVPVERYAEIAGVPEVLDRSRLALLGSTSAAPERRSAPRAGARWRRRLRLRWRLGDNCKLVARCLAHRPASAGHRNAARPRAPSRIGCGPSPFFALRRSVRG